MSWQARTTGHMRRSQFTCSDHAHSKTTPPSQNVPDTTCSTMKYVGSEATLKLAVDRLSAVRREIAKVIVGQDDVVEGVLICLLDGGHVLL